MNEQVSKLLKSQIAVPVAAGVAAFGTGLGLGYILGRRKKIEDIHEVPEQLELNLAALEEYAERQRSNIEEAKSIHPSNINNASVNADGVTLVGTQVTEVGEAFIAEKLAEAMTTPEQSEELTGAMFAGGSSEEWDYEKELENRSTDEPYVIHKDEFYEDELGYRQMTLTYYAGDDIMADEEDAPVYRHSTVVGPLKFGHGSGDPNVFHVRNDKNKAEYEIIFDPGLYSVEVMGLEIEDNQRVKNLEHSKVPKFRMD